MNQVWHGSVGHPEDVCFHDLAFPCSKSGATTRLLPHLDTKDGKRQGEAVLGVTAVRLLPAVTSVPCLTH